MKHGVSIQKRAAMHTHVFIASIKPVKTLNDKISSPPPPTIDSINISL